MDLIEIKKTIEAKQAEYKLVTKQCEELSKKETKSAIAIKTDAIKAMKANIKEFIAMAKLGKKTVKQLVKERKTLKKVIVSNNKEFKAMQKKRVKLNKQIATLMIKANKSVIKKIKPKVEKIAKPKKEKVPKIKKEKVSKVKKEKVAKEEPKKKEVPFVFDITTKKIEEPQKKPEPVKKKEPDALLQALLNERKEIVDKFNKHETSKEDYEKALNECGEKISKRQAEIMSEMPKVV